MEEEAGEEVDKIELSEISPVAKRRKKYVIEDSDSDENILCSNYK